MLSLRRVMIGVEQGRRLQRVGLDPWQRSGTWERGNNDSGEQRDDGQDAHNFQQRKASLRTVVSVSSS